MSGRGDIWLFLKSFFDLKGKQKIGSEIVSRFVGEKLHIFGHKKLQYISMH